MKSLALCMYSVHCKRNEPKNKRMFGKIVLISLLTTLYIQVQWNERMYNEKYKIK